ncbi:glycosyltransferase [Thermodesulfobacteriota bacterium]
MLVQLFTICLELFAPHLHEQGMVLTEAMAAGIPVVALDAPGVQEVVVDQKNGRLLYSENIDQFASALRWIASLSPKQKHRLRQEAGKTAQRFSMDNSVEKALSHYKRLLENESVRWRWHGEFNRWTAVLRRMKTDLNILTRMLHEGV